MNDELLVCKEYQCPYCGETIDAWIDTSQGSQQTIEDCSVCCRPIELSIEIDESNRQLYLTARSDSE
ncbi:MAG: CPXCG motif-containing cysteine-rich protein [Cycloclasticus sp.]